MKHVWSTPYYFTVSLDPRPETSTNINLRRTWRAAVRPQLARRTFRRSWGRGMHTQRSAGCAARLLEFWKPGCFGDRVRHPAGDSGTGGVPHWSSSGCEEARRGFPFRGIQAESAPVRLLGRCPGSLIAR
ncbi:hypothetical protein NDU88_006275 [Pleurodeles waltl]|uniref:Uncharacterized protein n=1 Tax=Pleurodeles waltl TaxID=8319 RepID=A0AAV7NPT6_PLEWA|nr:hypothetical protein NDU88_006275 [Pleurodeles waltl]